MSFQSNTVQEFVTEVYSLPYRSFIRQSRRQIIGLCHARNAPFPRWRTHCMSERINKPTDELNLLMQFLVKTEKKTQERNFYCLPFDCGIDELYDLEVITSLW